MKRILRALLLGMSSLFLAGVAITAQPRDRRLEKVLADWQKRQEWFQSVQYKVSGTHKVPKGAYDNLPAEIVGVRPRKTIPPNNIEAPMRFTILLDFVKGRYRRESRQPMFDTSTGSLTSLVTIDTFNGAVKKCLMPREENPNYKFGTAQPEMSIATGNMKIGEFVSNYFPVFFAHGRIYTAMQPILPGQSRCKLDSDYLFVHGNGVYEERPCLILRTQTLQMATTSFDEYWLDTKRESAIVRYLGYSGGKPVEEVGIHYSQSNGHWLPNSWHKADYFNGKVISHEEVRVDGITVNPVISDADFELEIKTGMFVEEVTALPTNSPISTPKCKVSAYRVKEDGGREIVPDPFHHPGDQYYEKRPRGWIWGCLAIFTFVGSVGVFWKRCRKRHER